MSIIQTPYDLNFFDETLFSILLAVSCLLWKGFYCIFFTIFVTFYHVYRCKITTTDLLYWLELLVKAHLIYVLLQGLSPLPTILSGQIKDYLLLAYVKCDRLSCSHEPEVEREGHIFFVCAYAVRVESDLNGICLLCLLGSPLRCVECLSDGFVHLSLEKSFFHVEYSSNYYWRLYILI